MLCAKLEINSVIYVPSKISGSLLKKSLLYGKILRLMQVANLRTNKNRAFPCRIKFRR